MKKKILPVLVFLVVISVVAGWLHFKGNGDTEGRVFVSGNIEATEVDLSFRIAGQINSLPIEEGDRVQKGQKLSTLDTDTLVAQQGAARSEIASARAVLDELEEGTRSEQILQARAQLKAAESGRKMPRTSTTDIRLLCNKGLCLHPRSTSETPLCEWQLKNTIMRCNV